MKGGLRAAFFVVDHSCQCNHKRIWTYENIKVWNTKRDCRTRKISQEFFECKVKSPNPRSASIPSAWGIDYLPILTELDFPDRNNRWVSCLYGTE